MVIEPDERIQSLTQRRGDAMTQRVRTRTEKDQFAGLKIKIYSI